jgi:DNA-binding CsgD family transcriptional regulator
MMIKSLLLP